MSEPSLGQFVLEAGSNPKVAMLIATGTASTSVAAQIDLISGILAQVGVILGTCTTAVVLIIQLLKLSRTWRAWRDDRPLPKEE